MLTDLPQDVLFSIFRFSEPQDLVAIRETCKTLYEHTENGVTWLYALQDILSITPHPALRDSLPFMSLDEFKGHVFNAARLQNVWYQPSRTPELHLSPPLPSPRGFQQYQSIHLLPGGEWVIEIMLMGLIRVSPTQPGQTLGRNYIEITVSRGFKCRPFKENVASRIHVYHVNMRSDTLPPSLNLVAAVAPAASISNTTVGGDLLGYVERASDGISLTIRTIGTGFDDPITQVVMSLSHPKSSPDYENLVGIRILSDWWLLLLLPTTIDIIRVPPMAPIVGSPLDSLVDSAVLVLPVKSIPLFDHPSQTMGVYVTTPVVWSSQSGMYHQHFFIHMAGSPIGHLIDIDVSSGELPTHSTVKVPETIMNLGVTFKRGAQRCMLLDQGAPMKLRFCRSPGSPGSQPLFDSDTLGLCSREILTGQIQMRSLFAYDEFSGRFCIGMSGFGERAKLYMFEVR
ncbi:hypothetical protein JAAARDRAFT_210209 [Jaapia argillacea MUCL 33604]|uniref:F-box domain-containing protein n=1 Tax=Jaapia argillacea MUCL 33604 TaxID=933084 RepID=A0A067PNT5_9AGAM|nr:hypothetical protein JAAARDRAFT_210209 [Jaapia argillacea MUCL 33604]